MEVDMNDLVDKLTSFADGLGKLLGHNCEVALYSSKDSSHKLIFNVSNQVTGRKPEDTLNHYELEAYNKVEVHNGYTIFSYTTKEGRNVKAALFILEDRLKQEHMTLIISFDITDILLASKIFQNFCGIDDIAKNESKASKKKDNNNIINLMERLVSDVVDEIGKPISYLSKEDKVKIVRILNDKGIFLVKGSIEYVAEMLCVSRYTIYNYLEEIR